MTISRSNFPDAIRTALDNTISVGTVEPVTGLTIAGARNGNVHKTTLTFENVVVALSDNAGVTAYAGKKLYSFPAGYQLLLNSTANLVITKSSAGVNANWAGRFGLGTVTASNDATLTGTEQNILPSTLTPAATAGVASAVGVATATEAPALLDGHVSAVPVFFNVLVNDTDHNVNGTACNFILNGTLTLTWINYGTFSA